VGGLSLAALSCHKERGIQPRDMHAAANGTWWRAQTQAHHQPNCRERPLTGRLCAPPNQPMTPRTRPAGILEPGHSSAYGADPAHNHVLSFSPHCYSRRGELAHIEHDCAEQFVSTHRSCLPEPVPGATHERTSVSLCASGRTRRRRSARRPLAQEPSRPELSEDKTKERKAPATPAIRRLAYLASKASNRGCRDDPVQSAGEKQRYAD